MRSESRPAGAGRGVSAGRQAGPRGARVGPFRRGAGYRAAHFPRWEGQGSLGRSPGEASPGPGTRLDPRAGATPYPRLLGVPELGAFAQRVSP